MFYFKIEKRTRAVPRLTSTSYEQVGSMAAIAERAKDLLACGEYGKLTVEAVSQADYVHATRPRA